MVYYTRYPMNLASQCHPLHHCDSMKARRSKEEGALASTLGLLQTILGLRDLEGAIDKPKKWIKRLKVPHADPRNVQVNVKEGKVLLKVKKEVGDSENGESIEIRRTFDLPDNADTEELSCRVREDGMVILEVPLVYKEEPVHTENREERQRPANKEDDSEPDDKCSKSSLWEQTVCMEGFEKENMKVSARDNVVIINGKMKAEDGGAFLEIVKNISVPSNVSVDDLSCRLTEEGTLVLSAPYLNSSEQIRACNKLQENQSNNLNEDEGESMETQKSESAETSKDDRDITAEATSDKRTSVPEPEQKTDGEDVQQQPEEEVVINESKGEKPEQEEEKENN